MGALTRETPGNDEPNTGVRYLRRGVSGVTREPGAVSQLLPRVNSSPSVSRTSF